MHLRPLIHVQGRRVARAVASGAAVASLVLTGLVFAPTAHAAPRIDPAEAGARWLEDQLVDGLVFNVGFGANDLGLSIDAGLALSEVPGHRAAVKTTRRAMAANINDYIAGDAFGDVGSTYAGATAKAAVFADRTGARPRDFGGVNLIARLKATIATEAPIAGRVEDISTFGDFANVIGQAYAAEALVKRSPDGPRTVSVVNFLLKQQCERGFFRLNFNPDKLAADQTCDGGTADQSAPDNDTTALVVLSLIESGSTKPRVTRAIDDAARWLARQQADNGSFGGGTSTEAANTNSTGLAAAALGAVGAERRAARAAAWIRRFQAHFPKPCRTGLTSERGAIALDREGFIAGVTDGITDATQDQWTRAHAQALLALPWAELNRRGPQLSAPRRAVPAESTVRLRVRNLEAGERVCVFARGFGAETATTYLSLRGGGIALPVPTPAGSGDRVYRLKSLGGNDRVVVRVRAV